MQLSKTKNLKKVKIFASIPMMLGMIFSLVLGYGLFIFIAAYEPARVQILYEPFTCIMVCIFTLGCATFAFCYTARRWFTLLVISEKGIETSLFHFFYRKRISWDDVTEILYYERLSPFIFITDGESIQNLIYDKITARKDVLQVSLTPKVYKIISLYYKNSIIGLTQEKIDFLKLEK